MVRQRQCRVADMRRRNPRIARYVRMLREMHAAGFTVDVMLELAFGPNLPASTHDAGERRIVLELYLEELPPAMRPPARRVDACA